MYRCTVTSTVTSTRSRASTSMQTRRAQLPAPSQQPLLALVQASPHSISLGRWSRHGHDNVTVTLE